MTPSEAGEHARRAGARRVVLTHISDELDPDWAREEGSKAFGAPAELARAGAVYEV
jgi:ribonuclease BN (tRNA processing enzyme)